MPNVVFVVACYITWSLMAETIDSITRWKLWVTSSSCQKGWRKKCRSRYWHWWWTCSFTCLGFYKHTMNNSTLVSWNSYAMDSKMNLVLCFEKFMNLKLKMTYFAYFPWCIQLASSSLNSNMNAGWWILIF